MLLARMDLLEASLLRAASPEIRRGLDTFVRKFHIRVRRRRQARALEFGTRGTQEFSSVLRVAPSRADCNKAAERVATAARRRFQRWDLWSDFCNVNCELRAPGFVRRQVRPPDRENLRALVYAFKAFFRFGNSLDRRDPEFFSVRSFDLNRHVLPFIHKAELPLS